MYQIRTFILSFFALSISWFSFGQKPCEIIFINGEQYCHWKPAYAECVFAREQIKKRFDPKTDFEIKTTINRLCYTDTIWGQVSTHLALSKTIDTTVPYKSFLKVFYSHTRDSIFLIEPYLFDPNSKRVEKILMMYHLKKSTLISDKEFAAISKREYMEMGKTIERLGAGAAFYSIDHYKIYSDRFVYSDNHGKEYIFLSFYHPQPDYNQPLYDNFLLLYCITDSKPVMNFPRFGAA